MTSWLLGWPWQPAPDKGGQTEKPTSPQSCRLEVEITISQGQFLLRPLSWASGHHMCPPQSSLWLVSPSLLTRTPVLKGPPHEFNLMTCLYVCTLSRVWLFVTPWTAACQAPLSMGFPRQEYWSGLPFPSPGDLPDPGIESVTLVSPALAGGFLTISATWERPLSRDTVAFWGPGGQILNMWAWGALSSAPSSVGRCVFLSKSLGRRIQLRDGTDPSEPHSLILSLELHVSVLMYGSTRCEQFAGCFIASLSACTKGLGTYEVSPRTHSNHSVSGVSPHSPWLVRSWWALCSLGPGLTLAEQTRFSKTSICTLASLESRMRGWADLTSDVILQM